MQESSEPIDLNKKLRLYVCVLDAVPSDRVPLVVAHSVLGAHLYFSELTSEESVSYFDWLNVSFSKVVCKVNHKEFAKIQSLERPVYFGYENKTLNGSLCCAIPIPSFDVPNVLKFAKLWTI